MIPLRDDVPARTFPVVNVTIIVLNVVFFLMELGLGRQLQGFLFQAAVVPVLFTPDHAGAASVLEILLASLSPALGLRVLLSMFLHGGWLHIGGNMLYLWVFGDNVEDRMGHGRYAVFYLLCGWAATYAHILSQPASRMPSIGASGAIAGVLGAYLALYPARAGRHPHPPRHHLPSRADSRRVLPGDLVPRAVPGGRDEPWRPYGRDGRRGVVGSRRRLRRGRRARGAVPATAAPSAAEERQVVGGTRVRALGLTPVRRSPRLLVCLAGRLAQW